MATCEGCCHLTGAMLNLAAEAADYIPFSQMSPITDGQTSDYKNKNMFFAPLPILHTPCTQTFDSEHGYGSSQKTTDFLVSAKNKYSAHTALRKTKKIFLQIITIYSWKKIVTDYAFFFQ
jgi:hypothetical protein